MFTRNLILSGLLAMASANTAEHDNYDDIKVPVGIDLHPVGTRKGLKYNSFAIIDTGINGDVITGLKISSPPNCMTSEIVSDILHGSDSIVSADGSSWTPIAINFGCTLATVESALGVPVSCNAVFSGFDKAGNKVAEQSFSFAPTGLLTSNMVKAVFNDDFQDVFKVTASYKSQTNVLTAVLYDDFSYLVGHKH